MRVIKLLKGNQVELEVKNQRKVVKKVALFFVVRLVKSHRAGKQINTLHSSLCSEF